MCQDGYYYHHYIYSGYWLNVIISWLPALHRLYVRVPTDPRLSKVVTNLSGIIRKFTSNIIFLENLQAYDYLFFHC